MPPGFYPDEAMDVNNGVDAWQTGHFQVFYPENNGREGLWSNIIGFFVVKFGYEPWIPRAAAAAFGLLTVLGIYFLAKELFSKKIALLSAFFMATSFWHINFSRIAFRVIISPFFLIWAVYFLIKSLKGNASDKKNILFFSALAGFFYGLGFYSYISYRATPVLILLILLYYWFKNKEKLERRKIVFSVLVFSAITLIAVAPLGFYFLKNPGDLFSRTSQVSVFSSPSPLKALGINILKTAGMFNFVGDGNWRHNYPGQPELFWPVGLLFLIGIILGIRALTKRTQTLEYSALFGWLIITSLPVIISNEGLPHALRSILMIPPVFILAGLGGIWLYKNFGSLIKNQKIFNLFVIIFLSLLFFEAYITYFILWGKNPNTAGAFNQNYVDIGRRINALPKEIHKYVIVKASGVLANDIPVPAQTLMYLTNSFSPTKQKENNISYCMPQENNGLYCLPEKKILNQIPENSFILE
jgi:4-amino-4-deoxy-L-arabinose transferase-like glycosyltransferase